MGLGNLGDLACDQQELSRARTLYAEAMQHGEAVGDRSGIASTVEALGLVSLEEGDYERALRLYTEALEIRRDLQETLTIALSFEGLATVALALGEDARGARLLAAVDALSRPLAPNRRHLIPCLGSELQKPARPPPIRNSTPRSRKPER